jgi:hypothetical protein
MRSLLIVWFVLCSGWATAQEVATPKVEITLTHLGTIRLPSHGREPRWNTPIYAKGYQALAADDDPSKLWIGWAERSIGQIQLPAAGPQLGDPRSSPFATWVKTPVAVGAKYQEQVVAAGQTPAWARLMGICLKDGKLWLNFGQYYHTTSASYANVATIDPSLDLATHSEMIGVPGSNGKNTGGWLAQPPKCWGADNILIRGNNWENGNDCGPRSSLFFTDDFTKPIQFCTRYQHVYKPGTAIVDRALSHMVDDTWSVYDLWRSLSFIEVPGSTPFASQKYWVFAVRKGTAVGWYGEKNQGTPIDTCEGGKGYHAPPYHAELWFFKHEDIVAVLSGAAPAYSPHPAQKIVMPEFGCGRITHGVIVGDKFYAVNQTAHKDSFAPTSVEYVNCLRVYQVGF